MSDNESPQDPEPPPGLYDCSPIQDGRRDRKKTERLSLAAPKEKIFEVPAGKGTCLGDIPIIEHLISKENSETLRPLHQALFKTLGQVHLIKRNLRKFNGFAFSRDSEEFEKKSERLSKLTISELKVLCSFLSLERSGSKEEFVERIMSFLLEPKDEGKKVPQPKKRKSSTKRKKSKKGKTSKKEKKTEKRGDSEASNSDKENEGGGKDDKENEQEEEDDTRSESASSGSEAEVESKKAAKATKRKKRTKSDDSDSEEEEEERPKKRNKPSKKAPIKAQKKKSPSVEKKSKPKSKEVAKAEKNLVEDADISSDSDDSDDEPLATKKKSFPSDAELKTVVESLLTGADLETVTMKSVLKDVYAQFSDVDLSLKKDFLKRTVKAIIS